jgi:protocatechuate 3,4-dioxygenase beta subunit
MADTLTRREAVQRSMMGALAVSSLASCGMRPFGAKHAISAECASEITPVAAGGACVLIPSEIVGPFPLYDTLATDRRIARNDIRCGLGGIAKTGVPLRLTLSVVNVNQRCAPLPGVDIYVWHCDKDGIYSGYPNQTGGAGRLRLLSRLARRVDTSGDYFLRGLAATDGNGLVRFTSIYPGWYAGRVTHVHFRVFLGNTLEATSQLAFPYATTTQVYNSALYTARGQNSSIGCFAEDSDVFSDLNNTRHQICSVSGDVTRGYDAALQVGIAL